EADALATIREKSATNESLVAPPRYRLGRNVEHPAEILDRMHRLLSFFNLQIERIGDVFHEQPQIVRSILATNHFAAVLFGAEVGYAIVNKLVRIISRQIQLAEQPFSSLCLLQTLAPR